MDTRIAFLALLFAAVHGDEWLTLVRDSSCASSALNVSVEWRSERLEVTWPPLPCDAQLDLDLRRPDQDLRSRCACETESSTVTYSRRRAEVEVRGQILPQPQPPFKLELTLICQNCTAEVKHPTCTVLFDEHETEVPKTNSCSCFFHGPKFNCSVQTDTKGPFRAKVKIDDGRCGTQFEPMQCSFESPSPEQKGVAKSMPEEKSGAPEIVVMIVVVTAAVVFFAYKVICRILAKKDDDDDDIEEKSFTPMGRKASKRRSERKELKVLLLYAREEAEEFALAVRGLRSALEGRLGCEVVDLHHRDCAPRLHADGFGFVEDFLRRDSCFNAHHDVRVLLLHTDWSVRVARDPGAARPKNPNYFDTYYAEALRVLTRDPDKVVADQIFHLRHADLPLTQPPDLLRFNATDNTLYRYPDEFDPLCWALKGRVAGNEEDLIADTPV
ncbi:uncharacterized protein LOC132197487 isoform X2 [Neocloeon triangulifer]|uniref:uncharacterized protein LOC132197487 isoform X2 n=1 Tax=Neocloeon triangulifer TaxID=2078957 RepID=UPI00286EC4E2|nr:uncharacterized protein LOC132197487 isoform X2 [Neocloeon triangulifer]